MARSKLTFPFPGDVSILKKIKLFVDEQDDFKIDEIYGVPVDGIIKDGRTTKSIKRLSREDALNLKEEIDGLGLNFNYLINAPFDLSSINNKETEEYLEWVISSFKPYSLTISSFELMKYVRDKFPDVKINVSTIAGVMTVEDAKKYLEIKPDKIVLHHDVIRNFEELGKFSYFMKETGVAIELMLTESCLRDCPLREKHYKTMTTGNDDSAFHKFCNTTKVEMPSELLRANFVRPEDVKFYESLGFSNFKITGRSKKESWMEDVVKAYAERKYDGNLIRLLGIDPCLNAEEFIFIDNSSLDGFLEKFPQVKSEKNIRISVERAYCFDWTKKLMNAGKFSIKGADYSSNLVCIQMPKFLEVYSK